MSRTRPGGALVASLAILLLMGTAPALAGDARASAYRPPARVEISKDVRLGQFSEALVTLWARCRSPLVVQELVVEVSQAGGTVFGSTAGDFGIECDGDWQRVRVGVTTPGGGAFSPGRTTVNAFLTVLDPETGDPVHQATDSVTVWVFGQAEVKVSRDVRLGQGDAILVTLFSRCEKPWVEPQLTVEVSQVEGARFGSISGDFGLVCDDRWHRIEVQVFSSGDRFRAGKTTVTASLTVLDPIDFDPVDQDSHAVTVWVKAPADVVIGRRAELLGSGSLRLPVFVRCQRPWIVQELSVEVSQGQNGGSASGDFGLECDGEWDKVLVVVDPAAGPFFPGSTMASAFFTVLDPDTFDPVDQAQDSRTISILGEPPPVHYD